MLDQVTYLIPFHPNLHETFAVCAAPLQKWGELGELPRRPRQCCNDDDVCECECEWKEGEVWYRIGRVWLSSRLTSPNLSTRPRWKFRYHGARDEEKRHWEG
jgi:hypothetical protein